MVTRTNKAQYSKLKRLEDLKRNCALFFYKPYGKQSTFHEAGKKYRERLLMAGNQLGKTFAAGNEVAYHLTGLYPEGWKGRVFTRAPRGWVGSVSSELTRDGAQRILMGPIGKWGSGCIPKELMIETKRARGVPDAIESILVKHVSGDISQVTFKSYKDGREAWQAETLDFVWFDEEPPIEIYSEGVTRTNNCMGSVFLTFTPLLGMSSVVMRFMEKKHPDRHITYMTIDDVEHYTKEMKEQIIASYPPHEREARAKGIPMLGSGRIFPVAEEVIKEPDLAEIPGHWKQIIGIDLGYDHPFAAVKVCLDATTDCIHVISAYRQREAIPIMHAAAIRPWGEWQPVAWPHDANQHDKRGDQFSVMYRKLGLNMISEHAHWPDGSNSVEPGLTEMLERMQTGRFKVAASLSDWWEEFRMYHRKDGKIVKERDDLMSATRYAVMMIRYAMASDAAPVKPDRYQSRLQSMNHRSWMAA